MGNSAGKEQRSSHARSSSSDPHDENPELVSAPLHPSQPLFPDHQPYNHARSSVEARHVRPEFLASMGIQSEDGVVTGTEWRKETRQEREARKLEKERAAREKERARSIKEEHLDGGYLVTQGVYTGTEDYNKGIVRQLMIERRLAPFWKGLNDHQDSWTEHQLVAAAKGLPIPAADEIPVEDDMKNDRPPQLEPKISTTNLDSLMVPITSRSQSQNSEASSSHSSPFQPSFPPVGNSSSSIGSAFAKGRSKTLATLTSSSKGQVPELRPREVKLANDPNVNGQRLEAYLYKDATECPICFLYYPPYLNKTRCCDQGMCSECFVQIKRPDPHPPEHADPSVPAPVPAADSAALHDGELISEPATCPFCKVPQFGITYDSPPFRRGLVYANHPSGHVLNRSISGMSSSSSLASGGESNETTSPSSTSRRRAVSVAATSPSVITTDQVRPDWAEKLASARAHTARRSAAATALHTAAYLVRNQGHEDPRGFAAFGRRGLLRRASGPEHPAAASPSSPLSMLAMMTERNSSRGAHVEGGEGHSHGGGRRSRIEDLEDMMMMEAIRQSLAAEEERRKREEKEAKKDAKKKEKEAKKAEKEAQKVARRSSFYPGSANASNTGLTDSSPSLTRRSDAQQHMGLDGSGESLSPFTSAQSHLERARAQIQTDGGSTSLTGHYSQAPYRPSHLRTQSNVSSSASSIEIGSAPGSLSHDPREPGSSLDVSPAGSRISVSGAGLTPEPFISGAPPNGPNSESMFNFRSLAAMMGDDEGERPAGEVETSEDRPELKQVGGEVSGTSDIRNEDAKHLHLEQSHERTASTASDRGAEVEPSNGFKNS